MSNDECFEVLTCVHPGNPYVMRAAHELLHGVLGIHTHREPTDDQMRLIVKLAWELEDTARRFINTALFPTVPPTS